MGSDNRIKNAARRRGLFLLREMAKRNPSEVQDVLALPAKTVLTTLDRVDLRLSAACLFRTQRLKRQIPTEDLLKFCNFFRAAVGGLSAHKELLQSSRHCAELLCLGRSELTLELVGLSEASLIEEDPVAVAAAVDKGLDFLESVWPSEVAVITDVVEICLGLMAPSGEVRCLSDIDVPGFVAIAHDNPAVLVAEQLVHEATHVRLAVAIEDDGWYSELISTLPPCYSPFKQSVRPAERTLHGVLSYGRVLLFWQAISRSTLDLRQAFGGIESERILEIVARRIIDLRGRISMGWASLTRGATPDEIELLEKLSESMLGTSIYEIYEELKGNSVKDEFSRVALAEFLLGAAGFKSSRIGVKVGNHKAFEALVRTGVAFSISNEAFVSKADPAICGFSNTFEGTESILFAERNSEVLCYVSSDPTKARATAELDRIDNAGDQFGIPRCCQMHFRKNWEKIRKQGGDLFAPLVHSVAADATARINWQCNSAAMYFGGGLCWHFPCSPSCTETIALVNQRVEQLGSIDPDLTASLVEIQRQEFFLSKDGNYKTCVDFSEMSAIHVVPF